MIVFTIYAQKLGDLPDQAKENLLNYVKSGKGFFVQHLATASFPKWEEFGKLCGRKWVMGTSGHGPRSDFTSKIVAKEHPITKGLTDFTTNDELYAKLQGAEEIHVLVQADSDWSKKTEPLIFVKNYGQGRVVHNAYGHDGKALKTPNVQKIIIRGTEWAATGKVTEWPRCHCGFWVSDCESVARDFSTASGLRSGPAPPYRLGTAVRILL